MLIKVRDKTDSLFVKDALDIDYDMSIEEKNGKYFVRINSEYRDAQEYKTRERAEKAMLKLADERNALEEELRNY